MNEPDPIDEQASAHLDGVATSDDPAVIARAAEFERVRVALRAGEQIDPQRRETIIDAALSAGVVVPFRRRPVPVAATLIGAAAAVAAIAFGLSRHSTTSTTAAREHAVTSTVARATFSIGGTDNSAAASAATTLASPSGTNLDMTSAAPRTPTTSAAAMAAAQSPEELGAIYRAATSSKSTPPAPLAASKCTINGTFIEDIMYAGQPAELWVVGASPDGKLVVFSTTNCQEVIEVPLP